MGLLKTLPILLLFSCAKLSYVAKQGYGQLELELSGKDNQEVLDDPKVSKEHKLKIRRIMEFKNYFYQYFKKEETSIYSETTFLDRDAVSYLVIASPFDQIKPIRTSFPFAGSFPYLGFYSLEDAKEYAKEMQTKQHYTFVRKVYAYSTLNKLFFKDNILSSFFSYDDPELAELIFHELTHTLFFVEDDIAFNESLADYVATEMTLEYLRISPEENTQRIAAQTKGRKLAAHVTGLVRRYQTILKEKRPSSKMQADKLLAGFLKQQFIPSLRKECDELELKKCNILNRQWNNASFTAFMTYNKKKSFLKELRGDMSLPEFLDFLQQRVELFEDEDAREFSVFLKKSYRKAFKNPL